MSLLTTIKNALLGRAAGPNISRQLEERGFSMEEAEDGTLTISTPDGQFLCTLSHTPEKKAVMRLRQSEPYRVLFSYQNGKYYVNDEDEAAYPQLLEALLRGHSAPDLLDAAGAFLLIRFPE